MTVSVPVLPYSVGVGAQITLTASTAKFVSESGNVGRKLLRPIKRNYMVSISPDDSDEVHKIILSLGGDRYPVAIRDPFAYKFDSDELEHDGSGNALLGRLWAPATGTRTFFERVLIADGPVVFELNGSPATPTVNDYGVVNFGSPLSGGDVAIAVSGNYLTPVCLMDQPSATAITTVGGVVTYQFSDLRFEQVFEAEFRALTA